MKLNKFERTELMQNVFSYYDGIKLEIDNRNITEKSPNIWKLNNTLLNKP